MKRIISVILAVVSMMSLAACAVEIPDEAAFFSEVADLIEKSYEVNEIFFGKGLEFVDPDGKSAEELIAEAPSELAARTIYRPVAEDAPYHGTKEIMDLARSVYSEDYADHLYALGFEGVTTEDETVAAYARYISREDATLTINIESVTKAIELKRTFDTSTLAIERKGRKYVVVTLNAKDGGEDAGRVRLRVNLEKDGWRLDWPTY